MTFSRWTKAFGISALLLAVTPAFSKPFSSGFCGFELPNGWECVLEGNEFVCQSETPERRKEAIIILAAKIRGPQDSLEAYTEYLKQSKTFTLPGGKTQVSEPKYTQMTSVANQQWVDSLHLASEVPGFFTRYMATVKEDLGMAVTFSVAKDHYDAYSPVFEKVIQTLRVYRQASNANQHALVKKDTDGIQDATFIPEDGPKQNIGMQKQAPVNKGGMSDEDMMLYGGIAAAILIVFLKKKKKK